MTTCVVVLFLIFHAPSKIQPWLYYYDDPCFSCYCSFRVYKKALCIRSFLHFQSTATSTTNTVSTATIQLLQPIAKVVGAIINPTMTATTMNNFAKSQIVVGASHARRRVFSSRIHNLHYPRRHRHNNAGAPRACLVSPPWSTIKIATTTMLTTSII